MDDLRRLSVCGTIREDTDCASVVYVDANYDFQRDVTVSFTPTKVGVSLFAYNLESDEV